MVLTSGKNPKLYTKTTKPNCKLYVTMCNIQTHQNHSCLTLLSLERASSSSGTGVQITTLVNDKLQHIKYFSYPCHILHFNDRDSSNQVNYSIYTAWCSLTRMTNSECDWHLPLWGSEGCRWRISNTGSGSGGTEHMCTLESMNASLKSSHTGLSVSGNMVCNLTIDI